MITAMPERLSADEPVADPFAERAARCHRRRFALLGGVFEFQSPSRQQLGLVDAAYAGLAAPAMPRNAARFTVRLQLTEGPAYATTQGPPPLRTQGGAGMLVGAVDSANFASVHAGSRSALVAISRQMLDFPYHARYELLEFAVFTLASRALGLAPLHAGCVGRHGLGLLLLGASGAGKSTLALLGQAQGLEILSEDATFVDPQGLRAHGVANFLHLRTDGLDVIDDAALAAGVRTSPRIRRRSGVEKFEFDLRQLAFGTTSGPLRIVGTVLMSARAVAGREPLTPLGRRALAPRLAASQPYAAGLPGWAALAQALAGEAAWELRRGPQPRDAARSLVALLDAKAAAALG